jgi:hypothetical protein
MDEFEFDNRLFYKFNSYNSTYFLGYPYKNLWLSIETEFKPNEIRKVAFFYDLYFPNKLKKNKIDIFDTNLKKLEKQLYDYFNPYFNNYRSNELYKFYYCYNHTFTKDVYDNLMDALANKKYSLLYTKVSTKNIIEIYKYLLIFYPNIFGKIGDLFYDFWKTKVFFPYFTDWQSGQKDFDFAGIKDFIYGDNDKLSKIQRQNLYFYFLDNIDKIKEIYLILNGFKLNDTFSEKVFQRILNNSCKHSNFWYDIGSEDLESLISLYTLFYSSTMETLPKNIKKERREKAQIFFCKNKLEVHQALEFLKDINNYSKLFDSFKNKHNDITDVNFLYHVALYYNTMFPYDNMQKFLINININFDNIKNFFDDPNNKNKFMDNIESIKKIKFSKDFLSEFERINKDKSTINSALLTDDILNYILDAYDIFFRNEIKPSDKIDKNAKLEFLKKNLNNVIKLYYICTNKKEEFDKDKIFTKQVYYEFMINSCTFGKDGWAIIDKDELKHIVFCYDILKIDKNKLNLASVVQEEQYNYFINNKDKLYSLISEIEKMYKIDFTYINNIYAKEIINGNTFHTFDTKDFIINSNTKDLNKLNEFIELVKYFYEDNKNEFIVEKKIDNTNPAKPIDYHIYKIKEENYKTIKELFDDKKTKNKLKDVNKIVYKNFLNYPKKFNYSIPQDTLIYIANKYNKMFPNELDSNYLIKKHKFLFFFEKTKPYPLLEYLIKFFSKNTLKLKILYETLNNIQSNSQKQKQSKQQQAQAQPQAQGQTEKDFIDKMKAIHDDATQIAQIKTNLGSILDLMEQERNQAIANIQSITTNRFYGANILSKLQLMNFATNKTNLTTQLITMHINDTYIDKASMVNIIPHIDPKYLKVILDLFEALKNNNNFDARNFLNRFSKIIINTQNNTIDNKERALYTIIASIFKNLNLLYSNLTNSYSFEISSMTQINTNNNIGKLIVFSPALIDSISDTDFQNELLKFVEFFKYVFFMFFFDFKKNITKKAGNVNNKKVILGGYRVN